MEDTHRGVWLQEAWWVIPDYPLPTTNENCGILAWQKTVAGVWGVWHWKGEGHFWCLLGCLPELPWYPRSVPTPFWKLGSSGPIGNPRWWGERQTQVIHYIGHAGSSHRLQRRNQIVHWVWAVWPLSWTMGTQRWRSTFSGQGHADKYEGSLIFATLALVYRSRYPEQELQAAHLRATGCCGSRFGKTVHHWSAGERRDLVWRRDWCQGRFEVAFQGCPVGPGVWAPGETEGHPNVPLVHGWQSWCPGWGCSSPSSMLGTNTLGTATVVFFRPSWFFGGAVWSKVPREILSARSISYTAHWSLQRFCWERHLPLHVLELVRWRICANKAGSSVVEFLLMAKRRPEKCFASFFFQGLV